MVFDTEARPNDRLYKTVKTIGEISSCNTQTYERQVNELGSQDRFTDSRLLASHRLSVDHSSDQKQKYGRVEQTEFWHPYSPKRIGVHGGPYAAQQTVCSTQNKVGYIGEPVKFLPHCGSTSRRRGSLVKKKPQLE